MPYTSSPTAAATLRKVFQRRKEFIRQTTARYEADGAAYPISSILLLGTGGDNWTCANDYQVFIRQFNAESDGGVHIVDARYEDFFAAAEREIREKNLTIPTVKGSFGISWEEWAAHLAGPTRDFREADRLLRLAEAKRGSGEIGRQTGRGCRGCIEKRSPSAAGFCRTRFRGRELEDRGVVGGRAQRRRCSVLTIARSLADDGRNEPESAAEDAKPEKTDFAWRVRGEVDASSCAIASLIDQQGGATGPTGKRPRLRRIRPHWPLLGPQEDGRSVPPRPALFAQRRHSLARLFAQPSRRRDRERGARWGFGFHTRWFFHTPTRGST